MTYPGVANVAKSHEHLFSWRGIALSATEFGMARCDHRQGPTISRRESVLQLEGGGLDHEAWLELSHSGTPKYARRV
jgi:hypothetical protein